LKERNEFNLGILDMRNFDKMKGSGDFTLLENAQDTVKKLE